MCLFIQVPLSDEERALLERLPNAWEEFKGMLVEVELKLENAKNSFCDTLENMVVSFVTEVCWSLYMLIQNDLTIHVMIDFSKKYLSLVCCLKFNCKTLIPFNRFL